uniref:Protein kinase domain-containing protein n=1 Tax=Acrobeloides nanus TaxID=290746 RepID=A0A914CV32_9BILA
MPIKWLAIESLVDRIFSEKSDVWAFGVLCYEVFSKGVTPYTALTNQEMMEFLQSGQRLPKPAETLDEIYEIMTSCWLKDSEERPNFSQLVGLLRVILERQTESYGYLGYDPTLEEEEDNGDESIAL